MQQLNFNFIPTSIQVSTNVNRILNSQKFRQVYLEGTDASLQRSYQIFNNKISYLTTIMLLVII